MIAQQGFGVFWRWL